MYLVSVALCVCVCVCVCEGQVAWPNCVALHVCNRLGRLTSEMAKPQYAPVEIDRLEDDAGLRIRLQSSPTSETDPTAERKGRKGFGIVKPELF